MGKTIQISQCMIVKNEEKNIQRALSWGKQAMWEQIVVDTGSTDRTMELAGEMGAKVFSFPWVDDFSAAKNYAISKAKGDWIAFLDADEYMLPEEAAKLEHLIREIQKKGYEGLKTGLQNVDEEGKILSSGAQIRFFRNSQDICYRRRIHEQLVSLSGRELHIWDGVKELSVFHTGYQTKVMEKKKSAGRNRRLLLAELKDHPKDSELLGYLGDDYIESGEKEKAEACYREAICYLPPKVPEYDQRSAMTFTRLLLLLSEKPEVSQDKVQEIYEQAVETLPKEADFDYIFGRCLFIKSRYEEAINYLEAALRKLETYGCSSRAFFLSGNLLDAYDLLVRCTRHTGALQNCVNYAVTYLRYEQYEIGVLAILIDVLLSGKKTGNQKEYEAIVGFFSKLYDWTSMKDRLFLIKAAELSECYGFQKYAEQFLFTQKEREQLGI